MPKRIFQTPPSIIVLLMAGTDRTNALSADTSNRFSLDYGNLTPSRADIPKATQFGQLTAKYRLGSSEIFKPYLGTGLAYSYQPDTTTGVTPKIRTGVAGQAGFSFLLSEKSSLNLDYRFLELTPDTTRGSTSTHPQSIGMGFEIKF